MDFFTLGLINWFMQIFARLIMNNMQISSDDSSLLLNDSSSSLIYPGEEKYFKSVRQLTFGGSNAEAYFSFDNRRITFQATNYGYQCDQIFRFDNVTKDDMSLKRPKLVSTGYGRTTCSYFSSLDDSQILYASTHLADASCPVPSCSPQVTSRNKTLNDLCKSVRYVWDVFPTYDIFLATSEGLLYKRLTDKYGYDAEGTVSPDGQSIVYTSLASGDLELWTMRMDGTEKRQVTDALGYDGGAFFSPDGKKLVFRASRPKTKDEIDLYRTLLSYNMVSPLQMELFTVYANGTDMKQITQLGGSNWAPFYHPDGRRIIFSSNHVRPESFDFQLFAVDAETGQNVQQITNGSQFNAFPMFTTDGRYLIFSSTRNSSSQSDINLFLAEWRNSANDEHNRQNGMVPSNEFYANYDLMYVKLWCYSKLLCLSFVVFVIVAILCLFRAGIFI